MSTPEQPPAAPDEPATAVHEPTSAGPQPPAAPPPPSFEPPSEPGSAGPGLTEQHPEILVGGAFVGGALLATVLKRLGR